LYNTYKKESTYSSMKNIPHKIHEKIASRFHSQSCGIHGQGIHQVSGIYLHVSAGWPKAISIHRIRAHNLGVDFLLTDRSETFKANGDASFNRFSANVHHSSSNLAASLSWLQRWTLLMSHPKIPNFGM
jgi:hypothetical protein